jgi:hypothetical protein
MSKTEGVNMKLHDVFIVFIIVICLAVIAFIQVHYQLILAISW